MRNLTLIFVMLAMMLPYPGLAAPLDSPVTGSADYRLSQLVFSDDFANNSIGNNPSGWTVSRGDGVYGRVEIVHDSGLSTEKAVHVVAFPTEGASQKVQMRSAPWQLSDDDPEMIAIEYMIKWIDGQRGIYTYINQGDHRLILLTWGGDVVWHTTANGSRSVGVLDEGWNHIRIVADRVEESADLYVNDMVNPIARSLPFQSPVKSWDNTRLLITHETRPDDRREAYYGQFKVWTAQRVEPSPPAPIVREKDFERWESQLRPTPGAVAALAEYPVGIPFYQGVPVAEGALYPSQINHPTVGLRDGNGKRVPAVLSASSLWPDGSVRWLGVDGVWSQELAINAAEEGFPIIVDGICESTPLNGPCATGLELSPIDALVVKDGQVYLLDKNGQPKVTLSPRASYIEIKEPKVILPDSMPDDERQYEWAQPLEALHPGAEPKPLNLRIRDHIVEQENDVYTVYRIRGDGGATFPGSGLEWQLRVRIYRHSPVVRMQMSWGLHWEPTRFALTQAEWVARFESALTDVVHAGADSNLNLGSGTVVLRSDPTGRSTLFHAEKSIADADWPDKNWEVTVAKTQDHALGIGIPNFTRLGPNHLEVTDQTMTFASWSGSSGYGLDLRQSAEPDEFQRDFGDHQSQAIGVMRTLEASLVWGENLDVAGELARLEARRDTLWLPRREDLVATKVFGPLLENTFANNAEYFEDVILRAHFVKASQDYWRWNGWINYGDIRTNYSRSSNPERGLHPGRWALHGRYGWRNGSTEPYYGLWVIGLALEDRDIAMMAMDYALHVADVDVAHGSFFGPRRPESGGIHRRNKDHWSGSVQVQYTKSRGLYLTQWLTGHERLGETLEEVREYSAANLGNGSAFAASAWINRYMETHDPQALVLARQLLDASARAWERAGTPRDEHLWGDLAPDANLRGLAALYKNNFRLPLDGIPVLIEFHEATRDPVFLETIATMMQAHGVPANLDHSLTNYLGLAYLLANGYSREQIGTDLVEIANDHVGRIVNRGFPLPRNQWTYETLATAVGAIETTSIGWRGAYAPLVVRYFGRPPVEVQFLSPRQGETIRGALPLRFQLKDPTLADGVQSVTMTLDGNVIYTGRTIPELDEIVLDTKQLSDGSRALTVSVVHSEFGSTEHSATFNVSNTWTLVQNMAPPVTQGWFGTTDFLKTVDRSEGWTYETGKSDQFFGDAQRLVRGSESAQYAVWETPNFLDAVVTLFVHRDVEWSRGIQLAVSEGDDQWESLEPQVRVEDGPDVWRQVRLTARADDQSGYRLFRLILTEDLPRDTIQVGEVILRGNHP